MCTFFLRSAALAVLLAGCSRHPGTNGQPAPRADTVHISVPVIRLTTADSANGSAALDSATLQLLERRIMSRVASLLRNEAGKLPREHLAMLAARAMKPDAQPD